MAKRIIALRRSAAMLIGVPGVMPALRLGMPPLPVPHVRVMLSGAKHPAPPIKKEATACGIASV